MKDHRKSEKQLGKKRDRSPRRIRDITKRKKMKAELWEDEEYFRTLIENSLDIIIMLDAEARIKYCNPAVEAVLGYKPLEVIGRNGFDFIHPGDAAQAVEVLNYALLNPEFSPTVEIRVRHSDGSYRFVEAIGKNYLDNPVVEGFIISSRDIDDRKRAEVAMRDSEEMHRVLIQVSPDAVTATDLEGNITYISPQTLKLHGYESKEELLGHSAFELIAPEDHDNAMANLNRTLTEGLTRNVHLNLLRKDGSRFISELNAALIKDAQGQPTSFIAYTRDITDRKRAETALRDSEEMHRALIQVSPDAVTATDLEGNITYISPQTLKLHGYESKEELLGRNAFELIAPEDHGKAADSFGGLFADGLIQNVHLILLRKDGSRFIGELSVALIKDAQGQPASLVAFTRDITERKRVEKELQDRNEELEAFAYTISHDLLTPATVVEGYAKAALEADAEGRPEAERECLHSIIRGARRMSDLIESLLQYAQAGHLDMEVERVEPGDMLQEILEDLKESIAAREAEIIAARDLPAVTVDATKLYQVLTNLMGNALKHMGDVPRPRIEIGASVESRQAIFHVRDNGVGIPYDLQKKAFEPFKHFSTSGAPGLGIGLATVKRAVETWGGRVWVESKPGEGATFYFTAPVYETFPGSP